MSENSPDFNKIGVFNNKSLADVFEDIYKNTKEKDQQINILIQELQPLIKSVGDAIQLIPHIKDYLDVNVRNNEHMIKLAAVVQRAVAKSQSTNGSGNIEDDFIIPQSEIDALMKEATAIQNNIQTNIIPATLNLTPINSGSNV